MITLFQETTDWGDTPVTNGIYHVNAAGNLVGYETPKSGYKEFSKPMKGFNKSGRKFEVVGTREEEADPNVEMWNFAGSKPGVNYVVTRIDGKISCTCPGATYRGHCKHINQVSGAIA